MAKDKKKLILKYCNWSNEQGWIRIGFQHHTSNQLI